MDYNPYQPPEAPILASSPNGDAEEIRKAHIKHEASVKSVGTLYFLAGALCIAMAAASFLDSKPNRQVSVTLGVAAFFVVMAVVQFWIAYGLRNLKPSRRIPTAIMSGIGLLGFPLGTVINAYIMFLVLGKKGRMVLSDEYKQIIAQTPHIKYKTSIIVWVFLGLLVLVLLFGLGVAIFSKR